MCYPCEMRLSYSRLLGSILISTNVILAPFTYLVLGKGLSNDLPGMLALRVKSGVAGIESSSLSSYLSRHLPSFNQRDFTPLYSQV